MGARRTEQCAHCPQTFTGSKSLVALDMREHFLIKHAAQPAQITRTHTDRLGHKCGAHQDSIIELVNGFCGYCFRHPRPTYEWYEPTGLLPFWRRIETAIAA